jgi:hypothetical protein
VNPVHALEAHLTTALSNLRSEHEDWAIHRSDSGRWLAIQGNTCIRANDPAELSDRIKRHLAESAEEPSGEQA